MEARKPVYMARSESTYALVVVGGRVEDYSDDSIVSMSRAYTAELLQHRGSLDEIVYGKVGFYDPATRILEFRQVNGNGTVNADAACGNAITATAEVAAELDHTHERPIRLENRGRRLTLNRTRDGWSIDLLTLAQRAPEVDAVAYPVRHDLVQVTHPYLFVRAPVDPGEAEALRRSLAAARGISLRDNLPKLAVLDRAAPGEISMTVYDKNYEKKGHPRAPLTGILALSVAMGNARTIAREILAPGSDLHLRVPTGRPAHARIRWAGEQVEGVDFNASCEVVMRGWLSEEGRVELVPVPLIRR